MKLTNFKIPTLLKEKYNTNNWIIAFSIYLVLVWGFAIIRARYLWITGDDPNLLVQSILTREGNKPNYDFDSGYPGLSQFTQSFLMHIFGINIFSEHLYTAILSTITGYLICINFSKIPAWILSTALIIVYCQEHLVNPTPNPGHLFVVILLILYTVNNKLQIKNLLIKVSLVSFILGISFLSKQYAIVFFGSLLLLQISRLTNLKYEKFKNKFNLLLGLAAALTYYALLIPNNYLKFNALINLCLCLVPFLVFMNLNSKTNESIGSLGMKKLFVIIATSTFVFISTIITGLSLLYGTLNLNQLLRITLFEAPRKINSNLVIFQFSKQSTMSMIFFILFLFLVVSINFYDRKPNSTKVIKSFKVITLIFFSALSFSKVGNLSANVVICIIPTLIVILFFKYIKNDLPKYEPYLFALTCYQFVLIPYPNINFHIVIYICGLLILVSNISFFNSNKTISVAMCLPILLVSLLIYKEKKDIDSMNTYTYSRIVFKSADQNWDQEIVSAKNANGIFSNCTTFGCKLLILLANESKLSLR
jgi:hypothetical protein